MEKEIETLDSSNGEIEEIAETDDLDALKEKYQKLAENSKKTFDNNKHLFERAKKAEGELKTLKVEKPKSEKPKDEKFIDKPDKLDYGQKSYLMQKFPGIVDEDYEWVESQLTESHLQLDSLTNNKYFLSALKERQAQREVQNAMPGTSKRSSNNARGSIDYWIGKGELPPNTPENQKLRREVVNAKLESVKNASKFSDNPVVQ